MTCDELKAAINDEIARNARLAAIRERIDGGEADFLDSELYTAITAEITAEQMRRNVLTLSDREPAFVGAVRERYTDTFSVFNAVQRILDAATGIRIRTVQPEFENDRAHKIGHSLNDPTVPESVIERRAYSATENFVRSQHDRCTKANASFRSRAGLDCRITRTGGAKCCDWCASVSGSFTASSAPDGIWGRHDNCKCSITYETRRGSFQQLSGSGRGWDTVEELPDLPLHVLDGETTGAGDVHAVSAGQAAGTAKKMGLHVLTNDGEYAKMILKDDGEIWHQITDKSIQAVPQINVFSSDDINGAVRAHCRALLSDLIHDEIGVEGTVSIRLRDYKAEKAKGGIGGVLPIRLGESYISIHNHPSDETFSAKDIRLLCLSFHCKAIIAIGNSGKNVFIMKKTESFDADGLFDYIADKVDGKTRYDSQSDFLKGAEKYGVKYYE